MSEQNFEHIHGWHFSGKPHVWAPDEGDDRIPLDVQRHPRRLVLRRVDDRQFSYAEEGTDGETYDTDLTGAVLSPIAEHARKGATSGRVLVDKVPYEFYVENR